VAALPTNQCDLSRRPADAWAVAFALCYPTLLTCVFFVALAQQTAGLQQSVFLAGKSLQFLFPAFWVFAVQRRRSAAGGLSQFSPGGLSRFSPQRKWDCPLTLSPADSKRLLLIGLLFGAAVFAIMLLTYHAWFKPAGLLAGVGQNVNAKLAGFNLTGPVAFFVLATFYSLLHSFLEEYYWRWFAFGQLRRWVRPWTAIAISALGFTGHHIVVLSGYFGGFTWPTLLFSAAVAVGGAFWAWLYQRSGSLLGPWLSHVLIDVAIFVVGYDLIR
jgi:uncharacterized protein